jgi:hypothetical protein
MIKMITAFTSEADIADIAIAEILEQIDISTLKKNSAGIVQCHAEFIKTGVLEAVCKALPFETVGISCSYTAVNGSIGPLTLTVSVLTSDECYFKVSGFSETESEEAVLASAKEAARKLGDDEKVPAMGLAYASFMSFVSGDKIVKAFSDGLPGVPLYGSLPISDESDFSDSYTIHNGESTEYGGVFLGIYGNIKLKFLLTALSEGKVYMTHGIVDKADGNIVYQINGMTAAEFVVAKGIATKETAGNIVAQPAIFTYPDGSIIMRNVLNVDFDKGTFLLSGDVHSGAIIDFALISANDVKASAKGLINEIAELYENASVVFFYSCATRLWSLGTESKAEIEMIEDTLNNTKYQFAFSGGEIYPMLIDGKYINTFQNNNLTACIIYK